MNKAALTWSMIVLLCLSPAPLVAERSEAEADFFCLFNLTERTDGYYTMKDKADGAVLLRTARLLKAGNEFIDPENRHYRVVSVEEDIAWAELIGEHVSAAVVQGNTAAVGSRLPVQGQRGQGVQEGEGRPKVGIYHSHGAESYVPSDGTESIDEGGGILDVGETFSESLEEQGIKAVHETETHVPHDAGAYQRSRRTALRLLTEEQVDALIDVHRDAVPAEEYEEVVEGERVTQILLVVGQQNQNAESNLQFARALKDLGDRRYPGLIKGILAAPGSYNQDLTPRAVLIEVGAHENRKEDAETAVSLFADAVSEYLAGEAMPERAGREGVTAMSSVLMLLVAVAAAVFLYMLIAAGGWEPFKEKAAIFFRREFADLSRRGGRRGGGEEEDRG